MDEPDPSGRLALDRRERRAPLDEGRGEDQLSDESWWGGAIHLELIVKLAKHALGVIR
jgi:hypothetical protein